MHVHALGYCYRSVEMVGRHAHRRGSPSAKVLCNIQPRSISCADREATRPTSKNACRPVCSGSGVLPLGNQVAVTFIDRLLPGVSLTIRGQPPARIPSTLFNVFDGRSAPLFLLFTLQYVSSSWTTDWTIRSHDQIPEFRFTSWDADIGRAACTFKDFFAGGKDVERCHVHVSSTFYRCFLLESLDTMTQASFFVFYFIADPNTDRLYVKDLDDFVEYRPFHRGRKEKWNRSNWRKFAICRQPLSWLLFERVVSQTNSSGSETVKRGIHFETVSRRGIFRIKGISPFSFPSGYFPVEMFYL